MFFQHLHNLIFKYGWLFHLHCRFAHTRHARPILSSLVPKLRVASCIQNCSSQNKDYFLQGKSIKKSSRPALCDSMFSNKFDLRKRMFEGMVIDGKCLELALEPQNEKDVKFLRGKMDREFLFVAPFFGKINHERCRENAKLQKVKRCEKVGVLQKCFWGVTFMKLEVFNCQDLLLKHIPSINKWVIIQEPAGFRRNLSHLHHSASASIAKIS